MYVFFAGAENGHSFKILNKIKVKNILISYFYLKQNRDVWEKIKKEVEERQLRVFVDSGAYSIIGMGGKNVEMTVDEYRKYAEEYAKWLEDNMKWIWGAANLDIQPKLSEMEEDIEIVYRWNEEFFLPLVRKGMDICFVWHAADGLPKWKWYVNESGYEYVGFSGEEAKMIEAGVVLELTSIAKAGHKRVHGFAVTGKSDIKAFDFYSVDSTSWLSGDIYGVIYHYVGGDLVSKGANIDSRLREVEKQGANIKIAREKSQNDRKAFRRSLKREVEKLGIDFKKFVEGDADTLGLWNAYQWKMWVENVSNKKIPYWIQSGRKKEKEFLSRFGIDVDEKLIKPDGSWSTNEISEYKQFAKLERVGNLQLPIMYCDNCVLSESCPWYKAGSECQLKFTADLSNPQKFAEALQDLISLQYTRIKQLAFTERVEGGSINMVLGIEMERLMTLLAQAKELLSTQEYLEIKAKGKGVVSEFFKKLVGDSSEHK